MENNLNTEQNTEKKCDKVDVQEKDLTSQQKKNKNNKNNSLILDMVITAMFIAVVVVSAQVSIPLPFGVPITLQTLAISLCGYCLGVKKSLACVLTYLLMGLVGIPVFSSFTAGIPALFGKTGGFIIGFIFLVFACAISNSFKNMFARIGLGLVGLVLCHVFGVFWFSYITQMDFFAAAVLVSVPFLIKDTICVVLACLVSNRFSKLLRIKRD